MSVVSTPLSRLSVANREALESISDELGYDIRVCRQSQRPPTLEHTLLIVNDAPPATLGSWVTVTVNEGYEETSWLSLNSCPEPGTEDGIIYCDRSLIDTRDSDLRHWAGQLPLFIIRDEDGYDLPVVYCLQYLSHGSPHRQFRDLLVGALGGVTPVSDEVRAERNQLMLQQWATQLRSNRIGEITDRIGSMERDLVSYQSSYGAALGRIREEQKLLNGLLAVTEDVTDTLMEQFKLLTGDTENAERYPGHPQVQSVAFSGGRFTIMTTPDITITMASTGEERWLGQFRIVIPIDGTAEIKLHNLNTRRGGRDHPHVQGDGNPCFGGHHETYYQLLQQGELFALVDLLIQYLQTFNENDVYGLTGSFWFDVPDERPVEAVEEVTV